MKVVVDLDLQQKKRSEKKGRDGGTDSCENKERVDETGEDGVSSGL